MTSVDCLMVMKPRMSEQRWASERAARASDGFVVADKPRIRDWFTARWRSRRLDLALASGTPSEAAAVLSLRARRLTDLSRRRSIANAIRRVVREAHEGARASYVRIIPCRGRVAAASDELSRLAATLAEPGPVAARGVAQACILLTDGTGPLYNPRSPASLQERAASAVENLRPWSA
jgi:hypothetical protein